MAMLDIKNLDKLTPEQKSQFDALLAQFPHLDSKMETSRELNTPSKLEVENQYISPPSQLTEEIDYSNFTAPPIERQFKKEDLPSLKINPLDASFSSLDREAVKVEQPKLTQEEQQQQVRQQRIRAAINAGQEPEIAGFSTEGKTHPVLQKMRATVGLRSVQEPVVVNIGGCKYSMRPLDRGAIANATVLAMTTMTNPMLYETNLENAIIAFSIVAIDGVPLLDVFSIPKEDAPIGADKVVPLTKVQREEKAAEALYTELMHSPNELVEALGVYYQQEFPQLSLLSEGKAKFLCPEPNCLQTRIADYNVDCFCPMHGTKMAREDKLPNPS